MGVGGTKKVKEEQKKEENRIHTRESNVEWENLVSVESSGYALGFYGETKTGKTITSLGFANLRHEMIPAWEKDYPLTAEALRDGTIPEINKIIIIDTENAIKKQIGQVLEKKLLKFITGHVEIKYKKVPISVPDSDLKDLEKGIIISDESAQLIFDSVELVETAIKWASENSDQNTLVIFDSASKYLDLLTGKGTVQYNRRIRDRGEEYVKTEGMHKYVIRKQWWDASLGILRGTAGWIISTFRVVPNSEYSIAVAKAKNRTVKYFKTLALDTTGFNLDMEYDFSFAKDKFERHIDIRVGRWVDTEDNDENKFLISSRTRFSSLKIIEAMLKVWGSDELFMEDDEFELPTIDE